MNLADYVRHFNKSVFLCALLLLTVYSSPTFAREWSLKDTQGIKYKLADQKGKWVVVNFWAPWCPPCIAELPELSALQHQHKDVLVIGVSVQYKKKQEVTDMVKNLSVTYPIVFGDEDTAAEFGGIAGLPTTLIYSPEGKLISKHDGPVSQLDIEQVMAQK
jgi:thiol-disulfide isomerase/thioredoxin